MSKKKSARRAEAAPTPAMIHALFVTLRALGWRSGREHAHGWLRPAPDPVPVDAATPLPTAEQVATLFEAAWQLGWEALSHEEIGFLHSLRTLSEEGISHFEVVATGIRQSCPWERSLAESCAGAYKVPHYADRELPPVSPATPREQALFTVLRQVGTLAAIERGSGPLRPLALPDPDAPPPRLNKAMYQAAHAFATELGWSRMAPRHARLIQLLRRSSAKGQDILHTTLGALWRQNRLGN